MLNRLTSTPSSEGGSELNYKSPELVTKSWTWVMAEDKISKKRRIYFSARDGMAITIIAILSEVPSDDVAGYLEPVCEEDGQKCSPLIIAALNGHNNVVKMLINRFKPNLEQEGTVLLDGYVIDGATALWCAAGAGHYAVVKSLVSHGADVNHPTRSNSTPLRAACFDGRLDIVEYLIENGADLHIANKYNNTCLMIAAYRGHQHVVSYLLSKNADINAQAACGATALHFAAEHGHLTIVKQLLDSGAKLTKNNIGMTPLIAAADRTKADVVEFLINSSLFTKEQCMEAFELLGASYANDKDHYSLEKAYYYMEWAMKKRCDDQGSYKPKQLLPPMIAYGNHIECQTLEELQAIKYNVHALHMESLVIRERILGSDNPEVPHPVIFRGAVFADIGQYDKCLNLLLHALHLRHRNKITVRKDLLRFVQVFAQMVHLGEEVPFDSFYDVLTMTLAELVRNSTLMRSSKVTSLSLMEELEDNIYTALYLFVISTKLIKKFTPEQENCIYELVYQVNKLSLVTQTGSTLLHLAVSTDTPVEDFHTKNVCRFPCAATTRMLIQCGCSVNSADNCGNTPLHIIVAYHKPITDFMTLHSIIHQLIEAGAHLDCVNNNGETPFDAVLTGVAEIILRTQYTLSLKCIAARAVRRYNIPYEGSLPESLKAFTDMHGIPKRSKKKVYRICS